MARRPLKRNSKELEAPTSFGAPYLVDVPRAITPKGRVSNLGQLEVKNGQGKRR